MSTKTTTKPRKEIKVRDIAPPQNPKGGKRVNINSGDNKAELMRRGPGSQHNETFVTA